MMADPSAAERAYRRLKDEIVRGALPVGPLDVRALGDRFRMSVTPVREALARLNSEKLVNLAPHQGYAVVAPSAHRLESLYEMAGVLIDACLERMKTGWLLPSPSPRDLTSYGNYADDVTALMREIAASQGNQELSEQVASLNDRLFVARRCEPQLFPNASQEADALFVQFRSRDARGLQLLLRDHHRVRVDRIDALARLVAESVSRG